uniref:Uncharacterized protein n=1 Tax=Varanus komodoensis TaxID=61221 RepID=A0A8D2LUK6_VARKO
MLSESRVRSRLALPGAGPFRDSGAPVGTSKDQEPSLQPASLLGAKGRAFARSAGEPGFGKAEGLAPGALRWDCGKPSAKEERDGPPSSWAASPSGKRGASPAAEEKMLSVLSPSVLRRPSPSAEDKLSRSSSALSEYVEELRRKRLSEKEPGSLALEDAPSLPIYQTTGASSLRRRRTLKDDDGGGGDDLPGKLGELGGSLGVGLARSSSLRSVASEEAAPPPRSPALKRISQFGSCDSLAQSVDDTCAKLRSPTLGSSRLRPWRSCLQASLEDAMDADLGQESLVFQGRGFAEVPSEGKAADPFAWKIPTLSYERKIGPDADDFPPAIRKTQSASSLSRGPRERKEGQRAVSVRFEDEVAPDRTFLSEMKALLSPGPRVREDPAHLSDSSDSSGSVVSLKSADSIKSRPKARRPEGEGCVAKAALEGAGAGQRSEAEGKEDSVSSIMMKYLGKE